MSLNTYLWVFAFAFMGCVFTTPLVTSLAAWAGAIDRPDQFRRIHKGAIPRMGGLGLAVGLAVSVVPLALGSSLGDWVGASAWWRTVGTVGLAGLIILAVGVIDDTLGMSPRVKLLGQAAAVLVLWQGRHPDPDHRPAGPRAGPQRPADAPRPGGAPGRWTCPAWPSRCCGSWAA
jgi:UDP-GlcNAc:undecaprenyl-phosphate GlcNAc-1-phosphate transferase